MIDYVGKIEKKLLIERGTYTTEELKGAINAKLDAIHEALDLCLDISNISSLKSSIADIMFNIRGSGI